MTYLEWNNIVSAYFFNSENDGKDIRLYASKADIIRVGRPNFGDSDDNFIWNDFVKSIRNGLPGSPGNVIENARYAFDKRNFLRIDSINVEFPPYITYLVILVIPLIEGSGTPFSDNNYYDRLNEFLEDNQINHFVSTNDFRLSRINELWKHLEDWANDNKKGSLGIFKTHLFTNERWVYVGRIFSQCILPPKAIKRLPELFAKSRMLPGSVLEYCKARRILVEYGLEILQLPEYAINAIKNERNEFGKSVIAIVQNAFDQWTGECHQYSDLGDKGSATKEFTLAKLFLQFKINRVSESISFSFRLFSTNTYPDDLQFGAAEVFYERNGWSRPINTSFVDSTKLKDEHNKWAAIFFSADVQIFVNAGVHQLSSDYWIETDSLSKIDKMYLLCRDNLKRQSIIEWGESFDEGDFAHEDVDGLPINYSLFRIKNPKRSHPSILNLIIPSEKKIGLTGGLRVNFRTYISDHLPEVEIMNCDGDENVVLVYKESGTKICLHKCEGFNNRWLLPKDCLLNIDFYTRVDGSTVDGDEIAYSLVSSNYSYAKGEGKLVPKRNLLDKIVTGESSQYCLGNNIINYGLKSKVGYSPYSHFFLPPNIDGQNSLPSSTFSCHSGNMLAGYLATKGKFSAENFFEAFEYYYLKAPFDQDRHVDCNLTSLKKASLSFYSALGICMV